MNIEGIFTSGIALAFLVLVLGVITSFVFSIVRGFFDDPKRLKRRGSVSKLVKILDQQIEKYSNVTPDFEDSVAALSEIALDEKGSPKHKEAAIGLARVLGFDDRYEKLYGGVVQALLKYDELYDDVQVRREVIKSIRFPHLQWRVPDVFTEPYECIFQLVQEFFPTISEDDRLRFLKALCETIHKKEYDQAVLFLKSLGAAAIPSLNSLTYHRNSEVTWMALQALLPLAIKNDQDDQVDYALRKLRSLDLEPKVLSFLVEVSGIIQKPQQKEILLERLVPVFESNPTTALEIARPLSQLDYQPKEMKWQVLFLLATGQEAKVKEIGETARECLLEYAVHPVQEISRRSDLTLASMGIHILRCAQCGGLSESSEVTRWFEAYEYLTEEQEYYGREARLIREPLCPKCNDGYSRLYSPCDDRFYQK